MIRCRGAHRIALKEDPGRKDIGQLPEDEEKQMFLIAQIHLCAQSFQRLEFFEGPLGISAPHQDDALVWRSNALLDLLCDPCLLQQLKQGSNST